MTHSDPNLPVAGSDETDDATVVDLTKFDIPQQLSEDATATAEQAAEDLTADAVSGGPVDAEVAHDATETVHDEAQHVTETVQDEAQHVTETVQDEGQHVTETIQDEAHEGAEAVLPDAPFQPAESPEAESSTAGSDSVDDLVPAEAEEPAPVPLAPPMSKAELIEVHPESVTQTIREASTASQAAVADETRVAATAAVPAAETSLVDLIAQEKASTPEDPDKTQLVSAVPTADEKTALIDDKTAVIAADDDKTAVVPPAVDLSSLYRDEAPSELTQIDAIPVGAAIGDEEAKLAAERAARKAARDAALTAATPTVAAATPVVKPQKRTTDKFAPALGMFLLRLALAAIFGIRGIFALMDIPAAQKVFQHTIVPQPNIMAIVVAVAEVCIAVAFVFGLLTRVAAFGGALIAGGALAFVMWGPWSPFVSGRPGFLGELELLIAAACLLLVFTGGGGWALDHGFRAGRAREREAAAQETEGL